MITEVILGLGLLAVLWPTCRFVKEKYSRFRQLNSLVATQHQDLRSVIWISVKMVTQMYWRAFQQWLTSAVETFDRHTIILHYTYRGQIYKVKIPVSRGPHPILLVIDEKDDDCTHEITPYFGPGYDWHNQTFKPSFWGKESLTFELSTGETFTFKKDEPISLFS